MSKIEKALDRAKQGRGMALVRTTSKDLPASESTRGNPSGRTESVTNQHSIARKDSTKEIARMRETALRTRDDLDALHVISSESANNPILQAFREIRTRVLQQTQGRNGVVLVTSATGGGGGSFVARNLAVAFALDAGKTSLLVDCDLRSPSQQDLLENEKQPGITDYLDEPELSISDIIHPAGIERLRVIPAGSKRASTAEYFMSARARQFLTEIRDRYPERFVFLDAPPIHDSADTRILAEMCDYVLLVVPYARVTNTQLDNCINSIDGSKLLGIVFNDEPQFPPIRIDALALRRLLKESVLGHIAQIRQFLRELIKRNKHT